MRAAILTLLGTLIGTAVASASPIDLLALGLYAPVHFAGQADEGDRPKAPQKIKQELKPLDEVWETAYVDVNGVDTKIGHVHLYAKLVTVGGKQVTRTTKELRLVVNRGDNNAEIKSDVSCDEDAEGAVSRIYAKLWLGKDNILELNCDVKPGNLISVKTAGAFNNVREFRWDPTCIGLAGEQNFLKNKRAKTGDQFTYRYFEPQVTNYVTVHVEVQQAEDVVLPGGLKRKLLKVIANPDPLKLDNGQKLQLPPATFWADPISLETIKTQMDITEIGKLTLLRTSKVAALAANGRMPDLMKRQSIYLKAPIDGLHDKQSFTYRVTYSGDALPRELLSVDNRQSIKNINGKSFDLEINARRKPAAISANKPKPVEIEFTESNYFITSDDAAVIELANRAVGTTLDPWARAQKIESFVRNFMRPVDYSEAMAPASHVAKTAEGDCTEYAMLTAAMCRAKGIPSRTAIGLVYVGNLLGKPGMAFHMWTEVMINGEWLGLDATLGRGSIGPGHIKITDHSWHKVISFTPLLPVKGFIMANPTIEAIGK